MDSLVDLNAVLLDEGTFSTQSSHFALMKLKQILSKLRTSFNFFLFVCLFETEVCSGGNSAGSDQGSKANPLYYGS